MFKIFMFSTVIAQQQLVIALGHEFDTVFWCTGYMYCVFIGSINGIFDEWKSQKEGKDE